MYFKHPLGITSALVILLTFVLFLAALFTKGWTQELLLEVGVFLVSVKLIIMGYTNAVTAKNIEKKLDLILKEERQLAPKIDSIGNAMHLTPKVGSEKTNPPDNSSTTIGE